MTMIRTPFSALTLTAALLIANLQPNARAQDEEDLFYLPDMEVELFDTKKLNFGRRGEFDKAGLVAALSRVASDFDPSEDHGEVPNILRSNALGIAGRIDPKARSFKTTFEQLEEEAEAPKDSAEYDSVLNRLQGRVQRIGAFHRRVVNAPPACP